MNDRLLKAWEVAALVGFTSATIVKWAEQDKIPSHKIGGRLRFWESEILAWIENQRKGSGPSNRPTSMA